MYAYVVTTIKALDFQLCQTGCGPNFDGGRITLCTCKHKDRATFHLSSALSDPWKNVWVAGLTSKSKNTPRYLAYLMCVERSFLSQTELWHALPSRCRRAKSASESKLGDLFEPKAAAANDPYNPANYYAPFVGRHAHSTKEEPNKWHEDVMRWRAKPHRLLLGHAVQSYRWIQVKMILNDKAMGNSAHHKRFGSLNDFIGNLEEFNP